MIDDPWRYTRRDPDELEEKMVTAIVLGGGPDTSDLVTNDEERALWMRLARSVAWVQEQGFMVSYSVPDDDVE